MDVTSDGLRTFSRLIAVLMLGLLVNLAGCQRPLKSELPFEGTALPLRRVSAEELIDEAARRVKERVRAAPGAQRLLDELAGVRARLAEGDRSGARARIRGFVEAVEQLVAEGAVPPTPADELLLYAGSILGAVSSPPLCEVVPAPGQQVPYFLYSTRIVCVARLDSDPANPGSPLPPNSREHCNPIATVLQRDLLDQALSVCAANGYTCTPVDPASCQTTCVKAAKPGLYFPGVVFRPHSTACRDEPVKKHACYAAGFYECNCACTTEF